MANMSRSNLGKRNFSEGTTYNLWKSLKDWLCNWMDHHLVEENVPDLLPEFEKWKSSTMVSEQFKNSSIVNKYHSQIVTMIESLTCFCEVTKQLSPSNDISPELLNHAEKTAMDRIHDSRFKILVQHGLGKLRQRIINNITNETQYDFSPHILKFYQNTMSNYLERSNSIYQPSVALALHEKLSQKLTAFASINAENDQHVSMQLDKIFNKFHTEKMKNLEYKWNRIKSLIHKHKTKFDEELDAHLPFDETTDMKHFKETAMCKLISNFEQDVRESLDPNEPMNKHLITLKYHFSLSSQALEPEPELCIEEISRNDSEILDSTRLADAVPATTEVKSSYGLVIKISLSEMTCATIPRELAPDFQHMEIASKTYATKLAMVIEDSQERWVLLEKVDQRMKTSIKHIIHLEEYLTLKKACQAVIFNGEPLSISGEFILATALAIIKQELETEISGGCSTALFAVPYWFCSRQRQMVLDAASIAGFQHFKLFNESSCIAFYCFDNKLNGNHDDVVVISETSKRVSVSMYTFDSQIGMQNLLSRATCYGFKRLTNDYVIKRICNRLFDFITWREKDWEDILKLTNAWNEVKLHVERNTLPKSFIEIPVMLSCERIEILDIMQATAKDITINSLIHHESNAALRGLAALYYKETSSSGEIEAVQNIFRESLSHDIFAYENGLPYALVARKGTFQTKLSDEEIVYRCKTKLGKINFFQIWDDTVAAIGNLFIAQCPQEANELLVTLSINDAWVVTLSRIQYTYWNEAKQQVLGKLDANCYIWEPERLTSIQIEDYLNVITGIVATKEITTIQHFNRVKIAISEGRATFKSESGKLQAIKMINESIELLSSGSVSALVLEEQVELLRKISNKHLLGNFC